MQLIDGWKQVLAGSWSVRFAALAALFSGLAAATAPGGEIAALFPALESVFGLESGTLATIAALFAALAGVVRVIPQPKLHERIAEAAAVKQAVQRAEDAFPVGSDEWLAALRARIGSGERR
jgi:hypothetical protein